MTSLERIEEFLNSDEPEYRSIENLSPSTIVVNYLRRMAQDAPLLVASKAVYAASLLKSKAVESIVKDAAGRPEVRLRIAAAGAARNLRPAAQDELLPDLIKDSDRGVRQTALDSVGPGSGEQVRRAVSRRVLEETDQSLRILAQQVASRLSSGRRA